MTSCQTSLADISIRHSNQDAAVHLAEEPAMDSALKRFKIPAEMAISPTTKWHQCKEGCLGCSCGDWCWTAVLANLNTIDWTHIKLSTVNQQTPFDIQIILNLLPLAQNSFQRIYYRSSLYIPSLAVACFHKTCDARSSFPKIFNHLWCHEAFLASRSMVEDSASPKVSWKAHD